MTKADSRPVSCATRQGEGREGAERAADYVNFVNFA